MEVNDHPNLEHGIEDQVGKDEIWTSCSSGSRALRAVGASSVLINWRT